MNTGKKPIESMPVRKSNCKTCPFLYSGWTELRPLLTERALQSTPICHSTGRALVRHKDERLKSHACRGARDLQLAFFHQIGFLDEPTDEAWNNKIQEINNQKQSR